MIQDSEEKDIETGNANQVVVHSSYTSYSLNLIKMRTWNTIVNFFKNLFDY